MHPSIHTALYPACYGNERDELWSASEAGEELEGGRGLPGVLYGLGQGVQSRVLQDQLHDYEGFDRRDGDDRVQCEGKVGCFATNKQLAIDIQQQQQQQFLII